MNSDDANLSNTKGFHGPTEHCEAITLELGTCPKIYPYQASNGQCYDGAHQESNKVAFNATTSFISFTDKAVKVIATGNDAASFKGPTVRNDDVLTPPK